MSEWVSTRAKSHQRVRGPPLTNYIKLTRSLWINSLIFVATSSFPCPSISCCCYCFFSFRRPTANRECVYNKFNDECAVRLSQNHAFWCLRFWMLFPVHFYGTVVLNLGTSIIVVQIVWCGNHGQDLYACVNSLSCFRKTTTKTHLIDLYFQNRGIWEKSLRCIAMKTWHINAQRKNPGPNNEYTRICTSFVFICLCMCLYMQVSPCAVRFEHENKEDYIGIECRDSCTLHSNK